MLVESRIKHIVFTLITQESETIEPEKVCYSFVWALPKNVWQYITWWIFVTKFVKFCCAGETWCLYPRRRRDGLREERPPLDSSVGNSVATDPLNAMKNLDQKITHTARRTQSCLRSGLIQRHHVSHAPQILTNFVTNFYQVIYYQTSLGGAQTKG